MSKHKQKKHKGPANRAKNALPQANQAKPAANVAPAKATPVEAAPKVEKKQEEPRVVKADIPKIEEPIEVPEVEGEKASAPKKSFFAGIIESVKKIVKPS